MVECLMMPSSVQVLVDSVLVTTASTAVAVVARVVVSRASTVAVAIVRAVVGPVHLWQVSV